MSGHSVVPLNDLILESQNGLSKRSGADGVETPVLRLGDIKAGAIDESDPREIRLTAKELAKYALQQGDLVCIRVNGSKALVGRVIQFRANRVWAYCDHFIRFRPNQALIDHRYLAHYFNSQTVRRHIELNMVSSAGQNTVSQGTMLDIPVPCPGLETQREIVAELEKQFSRLDEAVANLQRVKANLKRYKASVLKAAVEGRLVETEATLARREGRTFETGEQLLQRILEERRAKWRGKGRYKEPVTQTAEFTIAVTDGWTSATVDQLASVQLGKMLDKQKHKAGEPYRYLRNINVRWGTFDVSDVFEMNFESDELERFSVRAGDVLVCEGGEPARAAVWRAKQTDMKYQKALHRVRFDGAYLPDLIVIALEHLAKSGALDELYGGSTIKHFTRETFVKLVLPVPPAAEQARIVAEVDRHLSIIREVEVEVEANLQRAQALRQATLAKAFANT